MNTWESIFLQSPANDGWYDENELPEQLWEWPKGTWFQARLDRIRDHEPALHRRFNKKSGQEAEPRTVH